MVQPQGEGRCMAFWKRLCSRQNRCAVSADCVGLSAALDSARQSPKRSVRRPAFAVCRKKLCAALLFAAALPLLAGCIPSEFTAVKPHSTAQAAATDADIPVVSDYIGMRRAIRNFAENGNTALSVLQITVETSRKISPVPHTPSPATIPSAPTQSTF